MLIDKKTISNIISRIVSGFNPDKIFLFGSYANGQPNDDSDIDLLVLKIQTNHVFSEMLLFSGYWLAQKFRLMFWFIQMKNLKGKNLFIFHLLILQLWRQNCFMNANEQRLRDWIEKADHDLGTAVVICQYTRLFWYPGISLSASCWKIYKMPAWEKCYSI